MDDEQVQRAVKSVLDNLSQDVPWALQFVATLRSAALIQDTLPVHLAKSHGQLRADAVAAASPDGLFVELGVGEGHWINFLAHGYPALTFWGFDSFEGLPEPWGHHAAGAFDRGGAPPRVEPNVRLVTGLFGETVPRFLAEHHEPLSFLHLDCDLYSSAMTGLALLRPRMRPGTQIVLDDYMYMPGWERQEHKAWHDFAKGYGVRYEFTGWSAETPACSASLVVL